MAMVVFFAMVLGLLGMIGIYTIPARYVASMRGRIGAPLVRRWLTVVLVAVNITTTSFALLVAIAVIPHVFVCLAGYRCSSDRAGGLLFLAEFGVVATLVELIWWPSVFIARRWGQ